MTTPAVCMIPPTTKIQQAVRIAPRRPRGSEKEARKAPQKQPAVNNATTVPERESPLVCRKRLLGHFLSAEVIQDTVGICFTRRERNQERQSTRRGIGRHLTSSWLQQKVDAQTFPKGLQDSLRQYLPETELTCGSLAVISGSANHLVGQYRVHHSHQSGASVVRS
ncbi:hypothetical protein KC368_g18 [Hortaea werneckii]|nr:hypothetical protein KC368_g18 [Hortaea werneckii]